MDWTLNLDQDLDLDLDLDLGGDPELDNNYINRIFRLLVLFKMIQITYKVSGKKIYFLDQAQPINFEIFYSPLSMQY